MMMNSMDPTSAMYNFNLLNQTNRLNPRPAPAPTNLVVLPPFAPRQEGVSPTSMVSTQPTTQPTTRPEVSVTKAIEVMISTGSYTPPRQSTGSIFSPISPNPTAPSAFKFLMLDEAQKLGYQHGGPFVASISKLPSDPG